MKKTFKNMSDEDFEVDFTPHDIANYDVVFHVTLKTNKDEILKEGLLRNKPQHKSLVATGLLFFSYPVDGNTSDCFRWSDEYYSLIVLDVKKLQEHNIHFFDDYFGSKDASSKRNHICCDADIPTDCIKKVIEF